MNAADVMTHHVISVVPHAPIAQAIRLMLDERISGLPVVTGDGRLVGIVSEGDLLRRAETGTEGSKPSWLQVIFSDRRLADDYIHTHGRRVDEVMSGDVVTVTPETPLEDIVTLMQKKRIKRVPVLRGDRLVGIITRADLLRALARALRGAVATGADDAAIRELVLAGIAREPWAPRRGITVTVAGGVVDLDGVIFNEAHRRALCVIAENVPGVKSVNDHLIWVEPNSGLTIYAPGDDGEPSTSARL